MKSLRIGFIGNFVPQFSTENDRKWSFEKLGHTVIALQENKTRINDVMRVAENSDLIIYSHTHDPSYIIPQLKEAFIELKRIGKKTASVHLDRFAWLKRESDMGNEATWFTEHIFMADGSPEAVELYKKYNLNWHYLRPGVVERDCYMATPNRTLYPHDIVFVGSKGYHPEYPFRPKLVEWLHDTYGDKFAHYGNDGIRVMRGNDLNVLYASAKIVVGDSCFGGRDNYVSDRYYETRGRGGFLLHPKVFGVDAEGLGHYKTGQLSDLKDAIDFYLKNPAIREKRRVDGFDWVKANETYTNRAQEILNTIFPTEQSI